MVTTWSAPRLYNQRVRKLFEIGAEMWRVRITEGALLRPMRAEATSQLSVELCVLTRSKVSVFSRILKARQPAKFFRAIGKARTANPRFCASG